MESFNFPCSRSSESGAMSPWEVIEEALLHRRPARNPQWLADQLGVSAQVVSNWKARGVPAKRYRDIANALGITLDQLEGIEPLPWLHAQQQAASEFSNEVRTVAAQIDSLPKKQRDWVLMTVRQALEIAQESLEATPMVKQGSQSPTSSKRAKAA